MVEDFQQVNIQLQGHFFAVIILTVNDMEREQDFEEISAYRVLINDHIQNNSKGVIGFYDIDFENEAILFFWEEENYVDFISYLELTLLNIIYNYNFRKVYDTPLPVNALIYPMKNTIQRMLGSEEEDDMWR